MVRFRIFATLLLSISCSFLKAQAVGDYQSAGTGNWNVIGTWQTWNGVAWVVPGATPNNTNGVITILAGHTVTITANVTIDDVVIAIGGTLTSSGLIPTTINNSASGVDLQINGTFIDNYAAATNVITWNAGATWQMGATGTLVKTSASSSNFWQSSYQGGIASIPATANWIIRRNTAVTIPLSSTTPASGSVYPNLTLENYVGGIWVMSTATSSFTGSTAFVTVKGNLDVGGAGSSTLDFTTQNTNASPTLVIGNVTVKTGCFLRNNGTGLETRGNLIVNGSITYDLNDARRLVFSGGNAQSVSGAGTLNVYDCTLNKTGNSVTLNRAMLVDNVMTFTSGIINTTAVNLLTINTNGSVVSANNSSFVNGPCRYVGGSAFTFPVGKNADYQALSYSATSIGGVFWTEPFSNACASGCVANGWNGTNGIWTVTTLFPDEGCGTSPTPNIWYISGAECGNAAGACGTGCGATDPSLHVGSTSIGDIGAAFDNGGYCPLFGLAGTQSDARCESPSINCTGKSTITLSFNYIENGDGVFDNATLWYYNGASWAQLIDLPKTLWGACAPQGLWTAYSIVLPASADNNPNIKIGFKWVNNDDMAGTDPSFAVDDITLSTAASACDFTCEYFLANPQTTFNNVIVPALNHISQCEYWTLTRNAGTATKTVTLTWDANSCGVTLLSDLRVAHWDGAVWQNEGNSLTTGTTAAGTVASNNVTWFSPFTLASVSTQNPLPIEMVNFDGICTGHSIQLNWSTGTEHNNNYFTVERSIDGTTFSSIGIIDGAGNSYHLLHYSFIDPEHYDGINYYRIRQTDFNGQYSISKIISLNSKDCDTRNLILSNAYFSNSDLEIDYFNGEGPVNIDIYSADGRIVKHFEQLPLESNYHIETFDLSSSIYFIRISDGITSITKVVRK